MPDTLYTYLASPIGPLLLAGVAGVAGVAGGVDLGMANGRGRQGGHEFENNSILLLNCQRISRMIRRKRFPARRGP